MSEKPLKIIEEIYEDDNNEEYEPEESQSIDFADE